MTVFRSRRRADAEDDYRRVAHEMEVSARVADGFVDFKTFTAEDGEHVSLVTFASPAAHRAWRDDPAHRRAQQQGRDNFYLAYSVQVGACTHVSLWTREPESS
ncbi:MAG: antibiotic biosynthesis monooxygenase [Acidimicrobiales bacterium]|jgi:heme-degrading monooxygenase HmoA